MWWLRTAIVRGVCVWWFYTVVVARDGIIKWLRMVVVALTVLPNLAQTWLKFPAQTCLKFVSNLAQIWLKLGSNFPLKLPAQTSPTLDLTK
jgi:hypothetical protein